MSSNSEREIDRLRAEINRRRGEMSVARECLSDLGVPAERDGITLTMCQRIEILAKDREDASEKLSDLWIHLDSWARGEAPSLDFIRSACQSLLRNTQCPGWKE